MYLANIEVDPELLVTSFEWTKEQEGVITYVKFCG